MNNKGWKGSHRSCHPSSSNSKTRRIGGSRDTSSSSSRSGGSVRSHCQHLKVIHTKFLPLFVDRGSIELLWQLRILIIITTLPPPPHYRSQSPNTLVFQRTPHSPRMSTSCARFLIFIPVINYHGNFESQILISTVFHLCRALCDLEDAGVSPQLVQQVATELERLGVMPVVRALDRSEHQQSYSVLRSQIPEHQLQCLLSDSNPILDKIAKPPRSSTSTSDPSLSLAQRIAWPLLLNSCNCNSRTISQVFRMHRRFLRMLLPLPSPRTMLRPLRGPPLHPAAVSRARAFWNPLNSESLLLRSLQACRPVASLQGHVLGLFNTSFDCSGRRISSCFSTLPLFS